MAKIWIVQRGDGGEVKAVAAFLDKNLAEHCVKVAKQYAFDRDLERYGSLYVGVAFWLEEVPIWTQSPDPVDLYPEQLTGETDL